MWSGQALAQTFSLKCSYRESDMNYYATINRTSGAVVVEGIMNGNHYSGKIVRDAGGELQFELDSQPDIVMVTWQPATGLLTFIFRDPDNDARTTSSSRCEETALRPAGRSLE